MLLDVGELRVNMTVDDYIRPVCLDIASQFGVMIDIVRTTAEVARAEVYAFLDLERR